MSRTVNPAIPAIQQVILFLWLANSASSIFQFADRAPNNKKWFDHISGELGDATI